MHLDANTVLITGGASGIGFALARRFVASGSTVIVCGRRQAQLDEARKLCPELHTLRWDVSAESERTQLIEHVVREFPSFNVLVNNAGLQQRPPTLLEPQDWTKHRLELETNLHAPMQLSMLAVSHFVQQPTAAIINVSSGLAFAPIAGMPTYCATKAALHSFTLSLRFQLRETKIAVVEVVPPMVDTDLGGPGLHTQGVPLEPYADDVMAKLARGDEELGYQFSEVARTQSRGELDQQFAHMSAAFAKST